MLDDFLIRAILAGLGVVMATGALGSFVVWRRMAYFGDSTAHAAILGVALSLAFSVPVYLGTLAVAPSLMAGVAHQAAGDQKTFTKSWRDLAKRCWKSAPNRGTISAS